MKDDWSFPIPYGESCVWALLVHVLNTKNELWLERHLFSTQIYCFRKEYDTLPVGECLSNRYHRGDCHSTFCLPWLEAFTATPWYLAVMQPRFRWAFVRATFEANNNNSDIFVVIILWAVIILGTRNSHCCLLSLREITWYRLFNHRNYLPSSHVNIFIYTLMNFSRSTLCEFIACLRVLSNWMFARTLSIKWAWESKSSASERCYNLYIALINTSLVRYTISYKEPSCRKKLNLSLEIHELVQQVEAHFIVLDQMILVYIRELQIYRYFWISLYEWCFKPEPWYLNNISNIKQPADQPLRRHESHESFSNHTYSHLSLLRIYIPQ